MDQVDKLALAFNSAVGRLMDRRGNMPAGVVVLAYLKALVVAAIVNKIPLDVIVEDLRRLYADQLLIVEKLK